VLLRAFVAPMALFSHWMLRWSGGKRFTGHLFGNRDEFRHVMHEAAQGLTTEERSMIDRVLDLQHHTVRQITIPMAKTTPTMAAAVRARGGMVEARGLGCGAAARAGLDQIGPADLGQTQFGSRQGDRTAHLWS